jgi:hypothetical protein
MPVDSQISVTANGLNFDPVSNCTFGEQKLPRISLVPLFTGLSPAQGKISAV